MCCIPVVVSLFSLILFVFFNSVHDFLIRTRTGFDPVRPIFAHTMSCIWLMMEVQRWKLTMKPFTSSFLCRLFLWERRGKTMESVVWSCKSRLWVSNKHAFWARLLRLEGPKTLLLFTPLPLPGPWIVISLFALEKVSLGLRPNHYRHHFTNYAPHFVLSF